MTYEAIAKLFHDVSPFQVEYLVQKGHPTPRYVQLSLSQEFYLTISSKRSGRPPFIINDQLQELIIFVCASPYNCHLPWAQLPLEYPMSTWPNATEWSISSALRHAGFHQRIARAKQSISEANQLL